MYYFILGRETVVTKMRSWLTSTKQGLWKFRQRPRPRKVLVSKKESNQCDLLDEYLFSIAVTIDPINDYNFKLVCSLKLKFICVQSMKTSNSLNHLFAAHWKKLHLLSGLSLCPSPLAQQ
jgi:hypothetical protein